MPAVFRCCIWTRYATGRSARMCKSKCMYTCMYTRVTTYKDETWVRARARAYVGTCGRVYIPAYIHVRIYVRVNMAASIGKLHPKTRRYHRVINYRYGADRPLIRITIIAIDLVRAPTRLTWNIHGKTGWLTQCRVHTRARARVLL